MSVIPLHVLILEDRPSDVRLAEHELRRAGFDPQIACVETEADFLAQLKSNPEIIISDFSMPQFDAMRALQILGDSGKHIPFIIVSGTVGEDIAVKALQAGAWDYLLKDRTARLGAAVKQALDKRKLIEAQQRAKETQERLTAVLEATTDCVFMADPETHRLTFINVSGRKMMALGEDDDISQMTISDIHPEWANRIIREEGLAIVLREEVWNHELAIQTRDGREIPVSLAAIAPRDESGRVCCLAAIMRDVTMRNQKEAELRERMMLSSMAADIGRSLTQSDALRQMLQRCSESIVNYLDAAFARIWTLNTEDEVLELQASAGKYTHIDGAHARIPIGQLKIGQIARERKPHLTNDVPNDKRISDPEWAKREKMVAFAGYPLVIRDRLLGVIGIFSHRRLSDATLETLGAVVNQIALGIERKQSEVQLIETNKRLESLIDTSPLAIIAIDRAGYVSLWNRSAEQIFGWSESEVVGRPLPIIPHDQRDAFNAMIQDELQGEQRSGLEVQRLRQDGSFVHVGLWTAPIRSVSGEITGVLGMFADVSEKKQLESQFLQAQKMEAFGKLAGGVAHDFNNLLTVIGGYCEILLTNTKLDDETTQLLEHIGQAAERASGLTRQLLAFSRKQILQSIPLDLNSLLQELTKMVRRLIGEDIALECVYGAGSHMIKADPGQIEQVVMNLIVNARDAMPNGGQLTIETKYVEFEEAQVIRKAEMQPGSYLLMSVSDSGVGMDAATMENIFEPFFTTKEVGKGTGLGLAMVYGIVKQSDGFVFVYSEIGQGTTFKIYFPVLEKSEFVAEKHQVEAQVPRGTETILIVEDDEHVRELACLSLKTLGYNVLVASNGRQALDAFLSSTDEISLLVTDVVMPQISGRELVELVKTTQPDVKVLFVSGYTDDAVVRHGIIDKTVEFLQKPFTPAVLARKVREVLDRHSGAEVRK